MRKWSVWCAVLIVGAVFASCKKSEEPVVQESETANAAATPMMEATPAPTLTSDIAGAQLAGPGGVTGVVTFTQEAGGVHVVARVQGAKPGTHGFHLHAGGSCDAPDFKSAGDHFNPGSTAHGDPAAAPHHAGDFGNVEVGADGTGRLELTSADLSIGGGGANDILGKTVIFHQGKDDFKTQPSGNSGPRVACGVVQRAQGAAEASTAPAPTGAATPVY